MGLFSKKKPEREYTTDEISHIITAAQMDIDGMKEVDIFVEMCRAYLHSPDAKMAISDIERKANYSPMQARFDQSCEHLFDVLIKNREIGNDRVCETIKYVSDKCYLKYYGNKYPIEYVGDIIERYIAPGIRSEDHTGKYDDGIY